MNRRDAYISRVLRTSAVITSAFIGSVALSASDDECNEFLSPWSAAETLSAAQERLTIPLAPADALSFPETRNRFYFQSTGPWSSSSARQLTVRSGDRWPSAGRQAAIDPEPERRSRLEKSVQAMIGRVAPGGSFDVGWMARLAHALEISSTGAARFAEMAVVRFAAIAPDEKKVVLIADRKILVYRSRVNGRLEGAPEVVELPLRPSRLSPRGIFAISNEIFVTAERQLDAYDQPGDFLVVRRLADPSNIVYRHDISRREINSVIVSRDENKIYLADSDEITEIDLAAKTGATFKQTYFQAPGSSGYYKEPIQSIMFMPDGETLLATWRASLKKGDAYVQVPSFALLNFRNRSASYPEPIWERVSSSSRPPYGESGRRLGRNSATSSPHAASAMVSTPSDPRGPRDWRIGGVHPSWYLGHFELDFVGSSGAKNRPQVNELEPIAYNDIFWHDFPKRALRWKLP